MKRMLSLLLVIVLLAGLFPVPAVAEDSGETVSQTIPETISETGDASFSEPTEETLPETAPATEPEVVSETTPQTQPEEALRSAEQSMIDQGWIEVPFQVNPLYEGLIEIPDIPRSERPTDSSFALSDLSDYVSEEQAAVQLRHYMENRTENFTLKFYAPVLYGVDEFNEMITNMAAAHTGEPTQGDYLRWQYGGWGYKVSYGYVDGRCYQALNCSMVYYTTAEQEQEMDVRVNQLLNQLDLEGQSDYAKVKGIYDYICKHVTYDYTNLNDESYKLKFTAYAALMNGTAVCQGYAVLLYRLALELGVDCRFIGGIGNGGAHGWNIVRVDGIYYNADSTWDAGRSIYSYFLRCPSGFPGHTRDAQYDTAEFHSAYPMAVNNYSPKMEGTCGDDLRYTLSDAGLLTITGTGDMEDYTSTSAPWYSLRSQITGVALPDGITYIGSYAFSGCSKLSVISIPETVRGMGRYAFRSCQQLKKVQFLGDGFSGSSGIFSYPVTAYYPQGNSTWTEAIRESFGTNVTWVESCTTGREHTPVTDPAVAPTCTETGLTEGRHCSVCQIVILAQTVIPARGHTSVTDPAVAPTCTETGLTEGTHCSVCDAVLVAQTVIDAAGHTEVVDSGKAPTCTETGLTEGAHCSVCDTVLVAQTVIDATGHTEVVDSGKAPTCMETGLTEGKHCSVCNAVILAQELIPTAHDFSDGICRFCACPGGSCGENLAWIVKNGVLTVSGSGDMADFAEAPWISSKSQISSLVLLPGVTSVADRAFAGWENLTRVTLPESITQIGMEAFSGCTALQAVAIPAGVQKIGDRAFADSGLVRISFLGGAPEMGESVFAGVTAAVTYPAQNQTWAAESGKNFGGSLEWKELEQTMLNFCLTREYLLLAEGETAQLTVDADFVFPAEELHWKSEHIGVVQVSDSGEITALHVGTDYVIAEITYQGTSYCARCRVDVAENQVDQEVVDVHLGSTSLAVELFSMHYTAFDVIIRLRQNMASGSAYSVVNPGNNGESVECARFENADLAELFDLAVNDDRTLLIVPKNAAVEVPDLVGSLYTSRVVVCISGKEFLTDPLTLTVKKTLPSLKATALSFNAFYPGQALAVSVGDFEVTELLENPAMNTLRSSALPDWLAIEGTALKLRENAPSSKSAKAYLLVRTRQWAVPIPVTVSVRTAKKAPGLKPSQSSAVFAQDYAASKGVGMKLLCTGQTAALKDLHVEQITAPEGFTVKAFNLDSGEFILSPTAPVVPGRINLQVHFSDTPLTLPLTVSVSAKAVSLSVKPGTVSLNSVVGDSAVVAVVATPADYRLEKLDIRQVDGKGAPSSALDVVFADGKLTVKTTQAAIPGSVYRLYLSAGSSREKLVTVRILTESYSVPTMTLKVSGSIDLTYPDSFAVIAPVFRNYASAIADLDSWEVTEFRGRENLGSAKERFLFVREDGQYRIRAAGALDAKHTYQLKVSFRLPDGKICSSTGKVSVKQTAVKLRLSASTITLNKTIADWSDVQISSLTAGYSLQEVSIPEMEELEFSFQDGVLTVEVNEKTAFGATYRVPIRARQSDPAAMLTVRIPSQTASVVGASLKTAGSIDVIRAGTAVTLTPTYRNYGGKADVGETLTILRSPDGKNYTQDVTEDFRIVRDKTGRYVISQKPGHALDSTKKYRVELTFPGAPFASTAAASLSVKCGSVRLTQGGTPVLYRLDRNSRGAFSLTAADTALNPISRVEIGNTALEAVYEIYSYGSGQYAVGLRSGAAMPTIGSISIPLHVYLTGSASERYTAVVTLKLQIR